VTKPILPGATIGILGGGQLGRMTALAARTMGYRVHVLDPDPECAAKPVVDRLVTARFDDSDAAADLARHCDVVTLEIEQIGVDALDAARRHAPVRPAPEILATVQDRSLQKRWLVANGFPVGAYHDVTTAGELASAQRALGSLFVKANRGGYDGRSQLRLESGGAADRAWTELRDRPAVAEQALSLECEISVMVARRPAGETRVYSPALNHHDRQVLSWSVLPARIAAEVATRATEIARGIAAAFALEGILAVEMFVTTDGRLLVNELAPRPHNSYHESEVGCATSQFEQIVRAVCDLPLGDTTVLRPAAIVNLFGDLWTGGREPDFARALELTGVRLHLYGKGDPRPGRKMGHLSATGDSPESALALARDAASRLSSDGVNRANHLQPT
jgi:5-(carboxyamino)imidazole ribonucleotide synthase